VKGAASTLMRAGIRDLSRNRWLGVYAASFFVVTEGLLWFGGSGPQVALSLLNVVLLLVPLVSLVFGTIHVYASREFVELLLAQPVSRTRLFAGLYLGLALPLAGAFVLGTAVPFAMHAGAGAPLGAVVLLELCGALLTLVFAGVAAWIALRTDDRLKGVGLALSAWLLATLVYDGVVLAAAAAFSAWPLERPMLAMMLANPVDLARVVVLTRLDAPALMGYTGAVFNNAFGTVAGLGIAMAVLMLWCAAPVALAARRFRQRDF
jgi:Cu-processing system permease protein